MSQIIIDHIKSSLPDFFYTSKFSQVAVLVDENTLEHCYPMVKEFMPRHVLIEIKSGEVNKTLSTCEKIWSKLTESAFDRKSLLVNLGGGVIGDMGGFCASAYKRGISFINIPTTLLASVDASVGGKLGIDFHGFKNHIGFFQEPDAVLIDPIFLQTLPYRQLCSGFAEVIKHGLIADHDYYAQVISKGLDQENWNAVIAHSVEIKKAIVAEDPKETGLRKILNFGHTVGHAIESHYLETEEPLLHGEAISIGMICEAFLSTKLCGLGNDDLKSISLSVLKVFGHFPLHKKGFPSMLKRMYQDKKNISNALNHSLIQKIGVATYDIAVDEKDVLDSLFYYNQLTH